MQWVNFFKLFLDFLAPTLLGDRFQQQIENPNPQGAIQ
jgi:hypothetical protein